MVEDASHPDESPRRSGLRSWLRTVAWIVVSGVVLAFTLIASLLLLDGPATAAGELMIARLLPWPDGDVSVEGLDLRGLSGLTATGVRIAPDPDGGALTLDTLAATFSIGELLRTPRRIRVLRVSGLRIEAVRRDGSWRWLEPFDGGNEPESSSDLPALLIDRVELDGASLMALDDAGQLVLGIDPLNALGGSIVIGGESALSVEDAFLRVDRPGLTDGWLAADARLGLEDGVWRLGSVAVTDGEGGSIEVEGTIGPSTPDGLALDLDVAGTSFHIAQLHPSLSTFLSPDQRADIEATVGGVASRPEVNAVVLLENAGTLRAATRLDLSGAAPIMEIDAEALEVNADRVTGGRVPVDRLAGTLGGQLDLSHPDSLDGPLTLDLRGQAGGEPIRIAGQATFTKGEASVRLEATVRDIVARASGTVRPIGLPQSYDLELRGRSTVPLPAAILDREPAWRGPWDAAIALTGEGFDPDSMTGTLRAVVEPVDELPSTGPGTVTGQIANGTLRFDASLALGGGDTEASGSLRLADPRSGWSLTHFEVAEVETSPWLGIDDAGRLTASGTADADGTGLVARLDVASIRGGRLDGLDAGVEIAWDSGRTRLTGRLARADAAVEIERLLLDGASLEEVGLSFHNVDPSDFQPALPAGSLTGSLALDPVPAGPPDPSLPAWARSVNVGGQLDLEPSSLGGESISGSADLRFAGGEITFDARLNGDSQSVVVAGTARPADRPIAIRVREGRMANLDPSGWSGGRAPEGRINASFDADVVGYDPATARATANVILDSTRFGPTTLNRGDLSLELADGRAVVRADAESAGRDGTVAIDARLSPDGSWHGNGTALVVDSSFAPPNDSLKLALEFTTPDSAGAAGWHGKLTGGGSLVSFTLDSLDVAVDFSNGTLDLERLAVVGPDLQIHGGGSIPIGSVATDSADLSIRGSTPDLGPLVALTGRRGFFGRASFNLQSTGGAGAIQHEIQLGVAAFRSRNVVFDSAEFNISGQSDSTRLVAGFTGNVAAIGRQPVLVAIPGLPLLMGPGSASVNVGTAPTAGGIEFGWSAADPKALRVTRVVALLDDVRWLLEDSATVRWDDGITVDDIVVTSESGALASLGGRIDRAGDQNFAVEITSLPVQVRRRDGEGVFSRSLDFRMRLEGPASIPRLSLDGALRTASDSLSPRPWSVAAEWTDERLSIRANGSQPGGGNFDVNGSLPLRLSLAQGESPVALTEDAVDLDVAVVDFDLAAAEAMLDPDMFRDLGGVVRADVNVSGSTRDPRLEGDVSVSAFALHLERYGTELESDRITITLAGLRATVADALIRTGRSGSARVTGNVEFPELTIGNLDLEAEFDRFQAADTRELEAVLSGTLAIEGTLASPELRGQLELDEATWSLAQQNAPAGLTSVDLTESDYIEIERRFGVSRDAGADAIDRLWAALTLDLTVSAISNVWARRAFEPALAVEVAGDLQITKQPEAELAIAGGVNVVEGRSYIEEFGRRFEIADGSVSFEGPLASMRLAATATYDPTDDVTIELDVMGDSEGFAITLGSDPELSENDIISYIAVGKPSTDVEQFGQNREEVAGVGADIALSRLTGGVESLARQALGLDVVEIRQDGLKGLTLIAGRYLSRRFYIGFQQPVAFQGTDDSTFGIDRTEVDSEYRVNDWLLANLSGSISLARFFLEARYAY